MRSLLPYRPRPWLRGQLSCLAFVSALVSMLAGRPAHAQPLLSLDGAVDSAPARSGLVAAYGAQARAAREMALAAGQLPDPVLKVGVNNLPIDGPDRYSVTRDFMTMRSIGVMQEFTRESKRQARSDRARGEVGASLIAQQGALAELQRDVALAWLERSFQESMRELLLAQTAQAGQQVEAAQALYRSGKGSQADVFAARGEVELMNDRLAQADRQIAVATTQLTLWLGEDATHALDARPVLRLPAWAQGGDWSAHLSGHPQIAAAAQREVVAGSEAALANAARQADWSVELMVSQRGPAYSNMVSLNLSVPLQWDQRNRQDRELAARLAGVEQARAQREDLQRAHETEVRAMLQEWQSHELRLARYDTALLPLAEQRRTAALTAYGAGTGSLPALLETRRGELELRMERLRLEMDRARLWAQLNYLLPAPSPASRSPEALANAASRSTP